MTSMRQTTFGSALGARDVPRSGTVSRCSPEAETSYDARPVLEVLLVYEDLSSGLRGKTAVDRLGHSVREEVDLHLSLLRLDLLESAVCGEAAGRALGKADVLVLAARAQEGLPE